MPTLTIPEPWRGPVNTLAALSAQAFSELEQAMRQAPAVLNPDQWASEVGNLVPSIDQGALKTLLRVLVALSSVRIQNRISLEQFAGDVVVSVRGPESKDELHSRLKSLLEIDRLTLVSKASALQREHAIVFVGARVITDLRPVFTDSPDSAAGGVIVHTLKMSCVQDGSSKEIYVAMDDQDLAALQEVLARGQSKSKTMRTLLRKAELADLNS